MRQPSLLVLGVIGLLGFACSSTSTNGSNQGDACAQYAAALNSFNTRCWSAQLSDARKKALDARLKLVCDASLSLKGSTVTPQNLVACASALNQAACGSDPNIIPACDVPRGTLADDTACVSNTQCKSGNCDKTTFDACGFCRPAIPIGESCLSTISCVAGARCNGTECVADKAPSAIGGPCDAAKGEFCQNGLVCDPATKICKGRAAAGEPCSSSTQCQTGLTCNSSGSCGAPDYKAEGEVCGAPALCQPGLTCDYMTARCAKFAVIPPGGDCGAPQTVCERGTCDTVTRKCPLIVADGGDCGTSSSMCDDYAACWDGKCVLMGTQACK